MKKHTFIFFVAAVASLAIAACCKEEPAGPTSGGPDTIPTTDTIPVIDTIPTDTVTTVPWYASLVGTRWYAHIDMMIVNMYELSDRYLEFIDDSTLYSTHIGLLEPFTDTVTITQLYTYNPETLECTFIPAAGYTPVVYTLDTIEKTLSSDPTLPIDQIVYHLIEE